MASRGQNNLLEIGSRAPDFRLQLLGGGLATLSEMLARGPALLAFFKISCPVCQFTFPFLERLHASGTLTVLGISQNDEADTREFNQDFGVTFPSLLDREEQNFPASNDYGISSVPTMFLVEPDGVVSQVIEGWSKKDMEALQARTGASLIRAGENVPAWKAG